jgi:uncharacterized protein YcbX
MAQVGIVGELWRYPVKSMAGETLERSSVGLDGLAGDRGWGLRDERAGEMRGAKKLPALVQCRARYLQEPAGGPSPAVEMELPDGRRISSTDESAGAALSELLGREVTLWARQPASDTDHYRRGAPDKSDLLEELRDIFGRLPDEPLPDLSTLPQELFEFTSPPGTYFDAFPLHVLTTASLAEASRLNPTARFDVRRFRPNVLVQTSSSLAGFVEQDWRGRRLRIGALEIEVTIGTVRCVMTTLAQGSLPKDPSVLRTIVRSGSQNFGVYARVVTPATVAVGDRVELL